MPRKLVGIPITFTVRLYHLGKTMQGHIPREIVKRYKLKPGLYLAEVNQFQFIANVTPAGYPSLRVLIPSRVVWFLGLKPKRHYPIKIQKIG